MVITQGGNATYVQCNGPNSEQNDLNLYHGKGLISQKLYKQINSVCQWPQISEQCDALLDESSRQVGSHNVYDIYDNCDKTAEFLNSIGQDFFY